LKVRKSGLGLLMAASTGSNRPLAFVEDTAVPPERPHAVPPEQSPAREPESGLTGGPPPRLAAEAIPQ